MRQSIGSWRRAGVVALAILFTIGAAPVLAAGLSFPSATHEDIWRLLTAEIARDKELTSHGINRARMTQVQERLAPGIEGKERVLEDISGATLPLFVKMHALLEKTLADEKRIIDGGTHRYQRFAERALRGNLAKKEAALAELEKAIH